MVNHMKTTIELSDSLLEKAKRLARPFEMCGKLVYTVYDYVACRMAGRDSALTKAEERLEAYQVRLDNMRGQAIVTPEALSELAEDAALIDKLIRQAEREGDGAIGTVPAQ